MSSSDGPSAADQRLIDHAKRHGFAVTAKRLALWRRAGLLPGNVPGGGLGRGRGSTSTPPPESFDLVLGLARLAGRGKRPADLALLAFAEDLPVPEATVRAAFRVLGQLPPELAALDKNAGPQQITPRDATLTARERDPRQPGTAPGDRHHAARHEPRHARQPDRLARRDHLERCPRHRIQGPRGRRLAVLPPRRRSP